MKKFLSGVFIGFMVASLPLALAASNTLPFKDVEASHWAYGAIFNLYDKGFIKGYSDQTFRPNNNVTRAELSVILDRMNQYNEKSFIRKTDTTTHNLTPLTLDPLKLALQYPSTWGIAKMVTYPSYEGSGKGFRFHFSGLPDNSSEIPLTLTYFGIDYSAEGEGIEEMFAPLVAPKSCAELKAFGDEGYLSFADVTQCELVQHNGFTIVTMNFPEPEPDTMSIGARHSALLYTNDATYPYVFATASLDSNVTLNDMKNLFMTVTKI